MGLILVLKVDNIIIHSLCKYIKYNNLSMYKFRPSFLWHMFMLYTFSCMLVAHTIVWLKMIQYQIYCCKHDRDSCKRQLVACQLHSDWLRTTWFLVVFPSVILIAQTYPLYISLKCVFHLLVPASTFYPSMIMLQRTTFLF
jgi:hypothetical protein